VTASNMATKVLKVRHSAEYQVIYKRILKEEFGIESRSANYEKYLID